MRKLLKAFEYAFNGLFIFFTRERNGQIQLGIALIILAVGYTLRISRGEWIIVLGCIGSVLSLEMLNSAIEKICNLIQPGYHPSIKAIKDISAGAVLFASLISAIIGCTIFLPKLLEVWI